MPSTMSECKNEQEIAAAEEGQIISAKDWVNGGRDKDNAREWPLSRKIMTTTVVGGLAFTMFVAV